jgi:hypothetical protein
MPSYQGVDAPQSQQQSSMSPGNPSSQVDAFQPYRRDSGQVGGLSGSSYAQYQPSAFATTQMPQYTGYSSSYAQPPVFASPYQPAQAQGAQQHRQSQTQNHAHATYAPMHNQQSQQYVANNDGVAQDDGDNSDGGAGGVSVPPSY